VRALTRSFETETRTEQCCHSVFKKNRRFTLKKNLKIIKKNRHTKCLKKSKLNLKCTLMVLEHKH